MKIPTNRQSSKNILIEDKILDYFIKTQLKKTMTVRRRILSKKLKDL